MAGSYNHITNKTGQLLAPGDFATMVENLGDAYETAEEMYGMIWWLARSVALDTDTPMEGIVEDAQRSYRAGLLASPGTYGQADPE